MVVLLNRGIRTWDLEDGAEVKGKIVRREKLENGTFNQTDKVVKRKLGPNGSIEALDEHEAKKMLGYHEIVDAEKAMPVVGDRMKALQEQVAKLEAELAESRARIAKYEEAKKDEEKGEKGKGSPKGQ